ncbi:hypothetical protein [Solibacillus daqui]|uniref:hypothetical protein n=1 Tax=Solibacillus daqui TaxID=2912187 RepID=UPI002367231B|nr:hypothetical protein [Solibacillus daqui]
MWKVTNDVNYIFLNAFKTNVITKILKILLELSGKTVNYNTDFWQNTNTYAILSSDKKDLIDYIMELKSNGIKLKGNIKELLVTQDKSNIKRIVKIYIYQNKNIELKNYNIIEETLPNEVKILFVDFYYNKLFVDMNIWRMLNMSNYNRSSFHENFKKENELSVCPYCDLDTVVVNSNNNIEHFFPKSKFPLLSMNPYNLISSCIACNKAHEGKGDVTPQYPITMPYKEEISNAISFDVDFFNQKISLINDGTIKHENFITLLKLRNRYESDAVFNSLDKKAKNLFELYSVNDSIDIDTLLKYLRIKAKDENLIIALSHLIEKYPQYKSYLQNVPVNNSSI